MKRKQSIISVILGAAFAPIIRLHESMFVLGVGEADRHAGMSGIGEPPAADPPAADPPAADPPASDPPAADPPAADPPAADPPAANSPAGDPPADPFAGDPLSGDPQQTMSERMRELTAQRRNAEASARQARERNEAVERALAAKGITLDAAGNVVTTPPATTPPAAEEDPQPQAPEFTDPTTFGKDMAKYTADLVQWTSRRTVRAELAERARADDEQARNRQAQELHRTWQKHRTDALARIPNYAEVAENPDLAITPTMASAITQLGELGPDLAMVLGNDPKEAARIAGMTPGAQLIEIGVLKAQIVSSRKQQQQRQPAPPPIRPTGSQTSTSRTTADVGNDDDGSMDEYAARRTADMRGASH